MESLKYDLTNSELAIIETWVIEAKQTFEKEFAPYKERIELYTDIRTMGRFAFAREFSKNKTMDMWRKWVQWYESYRPDLISEDEQIIKKIHTSGKYRYVGYDKHGCPILLIRMRYHIKGLATADENLRYLLFMIEKGVHLAAESKTYRISVIFDRRNMAESDDVSSQSMKKFMPILSDCYPELLRAFYVLGANWFYRAMWAVVKIFISKRTEDKINLLKETEELLEFVDVSQLGEEYGGKLKISDSTRIIPLKPEEPEKINQQQIDRIQKQWKN